LPKSTDECVCLASPGKRPPAGISDPQPLHDQHPGWLRWCGRGSCSMGANWSLNECVQYAKTSLSDLDFKNRKYDHLAGTSLAHTVIALWQWFARHLTELFFGALLARTALLQAVIRKPL
jgi:hypothetical protein